MTKNEIDFESWFDALCCTLLDRDIDFKDADSVREDFTQGKDLFEVADEIALEYGAE